MNTTLQEAIKEAFTLAPANQVILHTIEIRQTGVQGPIYLGKTRRSFTANDENGTPRLFLAAGFDFSLPPSNEEGFQSLNVAIDNIGRRVTDFIETAMTEEVPVEMIYRPYVSTDLTQPQMDPPLVFFLKDIKMDSAQVTGRATLMDITNKRFPLELYTRERFPTLG